MTTFYSAGKLLITGEYVILDGALALALPTKLGQSLEIMPIAESQLIWTSYDADNSIWFETQYNIQDIIVASPEKDENEISEVLKQLLISARRLNPEFLLDAITNGTGYRIDTRLEFSRHWGLGSSSTLINNLAQWANVDAFRLSELSFGGSGYDIACAQHKTALTYQLLPQSRDIKTIKFEPPFLNHLYFVYLNKKQNSRDGIAMYRKNEPNKHNQIDQISEITSQILNCKDFDGFIGLLEAHESIIGQTIQQPPIKERLFKDFKGAIKSLGAWGGDFVLVASKEDPKEYFYTKGYKTIIRYKDFIKS